MTAKKEKKEIKKSITVRASKKGIDNCKSIAEKQNWSFSQAVSLAMENFKI